MKNEKHFTHLYKIAKKAALLAIFLAFSSSCTDQGCIEADDFGEYESQTLEVTANASQSTCLYDSTKDLTDPVQGSGIKSCLISGTHTIYDENNDSFSSTPSGSGCSEFVDAKIKNLCVNHCVTECLSNTGSNSGSSKPNWKSTDKRSSTSNSGVTIRPGSEITIRAIGDVKLGNSVTYDEIIVRPNIKIPGTYDGGFNNTFFDVRNGQTLDVSFSGQWSDISDGTGQGNYTIGSGTGSVNSQTYNASRRTIAYLIPHPSGYGFDATQNSEESGTISVPLLPDARAWTCDYSGSDARQSVCANKSNGYTSIYPQAVDEAADSAFPISSEFRTTILTEYGGVIRWEDDGLIPDNVDPFTAVTCDADGVCSGINSLSPQDGRLIGDLSSGAVTITNDFTDAYKISFRSLTGDNSCNISLTTTLATSNDLAIANTNTTDTPLIITTNHVNWSSEHISLEPGQKIIIQSHSTTYGNGVNCGRAIALKMRKYHDLVMQKSGFVKFTMLNGSGSCTVKGRIVNPDGWHVDYDPAQDLYADFYEYENFVRPNNAINPYPKNLIDPMNSLIVPATGSLATSPNWSNEFFVRKGQKIRFSPESWNGTWSAGAGISRQCGIGMAMIINPRPAMFCRGRSTDLVDNPACSVEFEGSTPIGCKATSSQCLDENDSTNFCPNTNCQKEIVGCVNGSAPTYQKTGCIVGDDRVGDCPSEVFSGSMTESSCDACSALMAANALQPAKISINNVDICYDLENYKGSVSNIPSTGFSSSQLNNADISRGTTTIKNFNGTYGNLEGFVQTDEVDTATNNIIFKTKTPLTFSSAGRLRFLAVDNGDTFLNLEGAYSNNSSGSGYTGTNAIQINSSSLLNFSNGEWLEVKLCKESSDTSVNCKSSIIGSNEKPPKIVELQQTGSSAGDPANNNGNYKFDSYGNLIRITPADTSNSGGDCSLAGQGVTITAGINYYCHKNSYHSEESLESKTKSEKEAIEKDIAKYRLSFRILDPEPANCQKNNADGNNALNTTGDDYDSASWNGIILDNPYYSPTESSNDNKVCGSFSSSCEREFYCGNKYSNNSGQYFVRVQVKVPVSGQVSSIISGVVNPVVEVMDGPKDGSKMGQAERVYRLLIGDPRYQAIVTMSLVVMFTFYGFGYLIGVSNLTHTEIISRIIKIGLIYLFIGEQGWEWFDKFVVKLFKDSTDFLAFMMASSFDNSPEIQNAIANQDYYDKSILFSSVDRVFSMFFSQAVQKKISALLFASIFGWAYLIIIYYAFLLYVYAVANAVLLYLTAQVFISILFTLGPIFFIFTLFAQTKEMFSKWLSQLIGFSLQQIFLLTTLAFFNMLMYEVIKMSLGYKICWDEVWTINILITRITLMSFWTIASLPPRTNAHTDVGNIGNPEGIPSLFSILFIWVIASLMNKFVKFMTDLAASIGGGISASSLSQGVADTAKGLKNFAGKQMESAWNKTGGRLVQRMDKALFDSGELAEKDRKEQERKNIKDISNKNRLAEASDKAVTEYKQNNSKELAGMSEGEKRKKLESVKNQAMLDEGKRLGLRAEEVKALKEDKGFKYVGENVFGAAAARVKQGFSRTGVNQSLSEREVDTSYSNDEATKAMDKMSPEERKQFIERAAAGDLKVKKTTYQNIKEKGLFGAIGSAISKKSDKGDYDKAKQQLEDEGLITRRSGGVIGEMSRNDTEKRLIRNRQRQNAAQRKADTKTTSAVALDELRRQDEYKDRQKAIDDVEGRNFATAAIVRNVDAALEATVGRGDSEKRSAQAAKDTRAGRLEKVKARLLAAKDEKARVIEKREDTQKNYQDADKVLNDPELIAAQKDLTSKDSTKRQAAERKVAKITSSKGYVAAQAKKQKATIEMHQLDAQLDNFEGREKDLEDFVKTAERAEAINTELHESASKGKEDLAGDSHRDSAKAKSTGAKDKSTMEGRKKDLKQQREDHKSAHAATEARLKAAQDSLAAGTGSKSDVQAVQRDLDASTATGKTLDEKYESTERELDNFDDRVKAVDSSDEIYAQALKDQENYKEGTKEHERAQNVIKERDALTHDEDSSTSSYQEFVDKHKKTMGAEVVEHRRSDLAAAAEKSLNSTTNLDAMKAFNAKYGESSRK